MPWIKPIKQKEMEELCIEHKKEGPSPLFDRMLANDPDLFEAFVPLQKAIKETSMCDSLREAIITFVSMKNGCDFCTKAHKEALEQYIDQPDLLSWLENYSDYEMSEEWKAALQYAERLIAKPADVTIEDIRRLEACGYTPKQIVE
ncbi:carboxymuconolactone decarboxylase family protein [Halobacillus sp. BBL2006]|uniref:carboxymuconolactone decarboxylase family protein n=1 Tax=Halobacillus sp. BBL2006 TaxID=1543706 RepID=UPI000543C75D|nr:carboxymuconolactone decarboxylase family protein [Halobacillus sp. BBL2006]KHE68801.1 hypothetical protein LD39_13920 [Halobacillus sp. BBL2006]